MSGMPSEVPARAAGWAGGPAVRWAAAFALAAGVVSALWFGYDVPLPPGANRFVGWFAVCVLALTAVFGTLEVSRKNALRLAGVTVLLGVLLTTLAVKSPPDAHPFSRSNVFEVLSRQGALGVVAVGSALVIITGGIDLSIGSVVGLAAVAFGVLMERGNHPVVAALLVLLGGGVVGLANGLLVTQLRLQAFLVTLCGMFVFRGLAREISTKQTGLVQAREAYARLGQPESAEALVGLRSCLVGKDPTGALEFPAQLAVLLAVVGGVAVLLHQSAYGRYWFAIGYNDRAARYAGVSVERQRIGVFVACSTLAALGGVLYLLYNSSADPASAGNTLELYAITAAVLGGVSLKGGEGTALGMALGALVLPVISNLLIFLDVPNTAEPWITGLILLIGTVADEFIRRGLHRPVIAAGRRLARLAGG